IAPPAPVGVNREAPRQRQRGDEGAGVGLVFVGLDRHHRDVVLRRQATGQRIWHLPQRLQIGAPSVLVGGGAYGEGACEGGARGVLSARGGVAEAEREGEL